MVFLYLIKNMSLTDSSYLLNFVRFSKLFYEAFFNTGAGSLDIGKFETGSNPLASL